MIPPAAGILGARKGELWRPLFSLWTLTKFFCFLPVIHGFPLPFLVFTSLNCLQFRKLTFSLCGRRKVRCLLCELGKEHLDFSAVLVLHFYFLHTGSCTEFLQIPDCFSSLGKLILFSLHLPTQILSCNFLHVARSTSPATFHLKIY